MRGEITGMILVVAIVVLGLLALIIVPNVVTGLGSAEAQAFETAARIALHINALSSMDRGLVELEFGRDYDIEIIEKVRAEAAHEGLSIAEWELNLWNNKAARF